MKTPMQDLISAIRKRQEDEDVQPFMWHEHIVELAESMIEKEKEVMVDFAYKCRNVIAADEFAITHLYNKTFNTKER